MNEGRGGFHVAHIEDGEHVSETVLRAVAALSDEPMVELPPIADTVDPDALDRLFASSKSPASLRFQYHGFTISIEGDAVRIRKEPEPI